MGTKIAISYAHSSLIRFNNSTQQKCLVLECLAYEHIFLCFFQIGLQQVTESKQAARIHWHRVEMNNWNNMLPPPENLVASLAQIVAKVFQTIMSLNGIIWYILEQSPTNVNFVVVRFDSDLISNVIGPSIIQRHCLVGNQKWEINKLLWSAVTNWFMGDLLRDINKLLWSVLTKWFVENLQ